MYDYIVIGAGSAGCTLASRLSERPHLNVLLIEAGLADRRQEIQIPAVFPKLFKSTVDWNFATEHQAQLMGRSLYWPRGKVLGGSSSMNAMVYTRGRAGDFDHWREMGNEGWGFSDVLPYFQAAENQLNITNLVSPHPLSALFVEACEQTGIPRKSDFNGASQAGVGFFSVTQRKGRRWSAADVYLRPALRRGNLTVWTGINATRVLIENGRASGVEYRQKNAVHHVRAEREVILCAGAIGSPHLLLCSGLGPRRQLELHGIPVIADLEGVGENLQDHLSGTASYFCNQPVPLVGEGTFGNLFAYFVRGDGPLTSNVFEAGAFVKSRSNLTECDLEFQFAPVHYVDHGLAKPDGYGFSLVSILLTPLSRGRITLRSADPLEPPAIDPCYLSDPDDLAPLIRGLELSHRIIGAAPFDPYRGEPLFPKTDPEAYLRARAETFYHPVGTCKMGQDNWSVVNSRLQVYGVTGLRVADASVMPVIIGGDTNAATIMIAEKAADLIRE